MKENKHKDTKEKVTIAPRKRYEDPRIIQVNVDMPLIWCYGKEGWDGKSPDENRVMSLRNLKKFVKEIQKRTRTIKDMNDSHYWVSGYLEVWFYMKSKGDRKMTKRIVQEALKESGGFMTWEEWLKEHKRPKMQMWSFHGTGSNIQGGMINSNSVIPFL